MFSFQRRHCSTCAASVFRFVRRIQLSGEELELFKNYVEDHQALSCEANADSFIIGFRFGASFTYDTFVGKVVPYSDFMEDDKNA